MTVFVEAGGGFPSAGLTPSRTRSRWKDRRRPVGTGPPGRGGVTNLKP